MEHLKMRPKLLLEISLKEYNGIDTNIVLQRKKPPEWIRGAYQSFYQKKPSKDLGEGFTT